MTEAASDSHDRTTAPMQAFSTREALLGGLVAALGMTVVFGVPILLV